MPIEPTEFVWKNGSFVPWQEATVHTMAHGLNYGSSVFEGLRAYPTPQGTALFRLTDHTRRLLESAKIYGLDVPYSVETINQACREVITKNGLTAAYVRPLIYCGLGSLAITIDECPREMVIAAFPWGALHGAGSREKGLEVCVSSWRRNTSASNPVLAKAGGHYLNSLLIASEAKRNGYDEGLAVDANGMLSEGSVVNAFVIRKGEIFTPPVSSSILQGITRDTVIRLAESLGIAVHVELIPRESIYAADEVFLTGTASEIAPVRSLDRKPIGNGNVGEVTKRIQDAFFRLFQDPGTDSHGWLDFVDSPAVSSASNGSPNS